LTCASVAGWGRARRQACGSERILSVAERAKSLFSKEAGSSADTSAKGGSKAKPSKRQLGLFAEIEAAEKDGLLGEAGVRSCSATTLNSSAPPSWNAISPHGVFRRGVPSVPPRPVIESNSVPTKTAVFAFGTLSTFAPLRIVETPFHP